MLGQQLQEIFGEKRELRAATKQKERPSYAGPRQKAAENDLRKLNYGNKPGVDPIETRVTRPQRNGTRTGQGFLTHCKG